MTFSSAIYWSDFKILRGDLSLIYEVRQMQLGLKYFLKAFVTKTHANYCNDIIKVNNFLQHPVFVHSMTLQFKKNPKIPHKI